MKLGIIGAMTVEIESLKAQMKNLEITEKAAEALLKICPEHDICISAEAKGIPLCYEMARQGCGKYIIARKGVKVYMPDPISVNVQSITTLSRQTLYLGSDDADEMNGKRILIVDDIVTSGYTLGFCCRVISRAKPSALCCAAIASAHDKYPQSTAI